MDKAFKMQCNLAWKQTFGKDQKERFQNAQKYIDSQCIRLMVKYTPARNNILYKTAALGTTIGSGRIYYVSPYARYQYYGKLMVSSVNGSAWARHGESKVPTGKDLQYDKTRHPQAQKLWFETMKKNHAPAILRGAARYAGGKPR